jgi:hypothetical protein
MSMALVVSTHLRLLEQLVAEELRVLEQAAGVRAFGRRELAGLHAKTTYNTRTPHTKSGIWSD